MQRAEPCAAAALHNQSHPGLSPVDLFWVPALILVEDADGALIPVKFSGRRNPASIPVEIADAA